MITKFCIEVETEFPVFYDKIDDVDISDDVEENFHDSLFKVVEDFLTGDELEPWTLDNMNDDEMRMPRDKIFKEFGEIGKITIHIHHPKKTANSVRPEIEPDKDRKLTDFTNIFSRGVPCH